MHTGKVLVADRNGVFVLKLVGDVRLTCSTALDEYTERMFANPAFSGVVVDLSAAENIDSTTLGLLAKVAITARKQFNLTPTIISTNPNITRIIDSMGFDTVFDIREQAPSGEAELAELPAVTCSEAAMREKVIEAHRVLMDMNPKNRAEFHELVKALEGGR